MADWFEREHGKGLALEEGMVWGTFHLPERKFQLLGNVRGKDILELGCGAARWSIALQRRGARVVALDLSPRRLAQARREARRAGVGLRLIEASAEAVPLPDASFDIIFCDHGAMSFADPYRTVPEVARLLRPGGQLTFSHSSALQHICRDEPRDRITTSLMVPYFDLHRVEGPKMVEFALPYGEWIRLFRENGLTVERLLEPRAPANLRSSFLTPPELAWARRWAFESIWTVRKLPASPRAPASRRRGVRPRQNGA